MGAIPIGIVLRLRRALRKRTIPLNTLFKELLKAAHDKSVKMQPFVLEAEPAADQVARYRSLAADGCFTITPVYRNTVALMVGAAIESPTIFHVTQRGSQSYARDNAESKEEETTGEDEYDSDDAEEEVEILEMPQQGWVVDVEAGTCTCRTWRKHAYCVHLIACRIMLKLDVVGFKPPRVKFVTKGAGKKTPSRGRTPRVGHALAKE